MNKYQICALLGILVMGVSAFAACLSQTTLIMTIGNIGILASIAIMAYGFTYWQP